MAIDETVVDNQGEGTQQDAEPLEIEVGRTYTEVQIAEAGLESSSQFPMGGFWIYQRKVKKKVVKDNEEKEQIVTEQYMLKKITGDGETGYRVESKQTLVL